MPFDMRYKMRSNQKLSICRRVRASLLRIMYHDHSDFSPLPLLDVKIGIFIDFDPIEVG